MSRMLKAQTISSLELRQEPLPQLFPATAQ
jgi:hypothetical protein